MKLYHVHFEGVQAGPFTEDAIQSKLASGELNRDTFCWTEGMNEWSPIHAVILIQTSTPPPPPGPPPFTKQGPQMPPPYNVSTVLPTHQAITSSKAARFSMLLGGITLVAWIIGVPIVAHAFQHGHYKLISDLPILVKSFMLLLPACFVLNIIGFICGIFGLLPRFSNRHHGLIGMALNSGGFVILIVFGILSDR